MTRVLFCLTLLAGITVHAQRAADLKLASIHVNGVKRYAVEDVARLSGLTIGRAATADDLAAAANRLASTGLFDSVRYSYTTNRVLDVTFEVEEAAWTVPVILDNFIWFTDEQLTAALRAEVPSFDGTAPLNQGAAEFINAALGRIVSGRGVPGRVVFTPHVTLGRNDATYMFAVKDPSPQVCGIRITGAAAIGESELSAQLRGAVGTDYSRFFFSAASKGTLLDMYRRKGFWRATFAAPQTDVNTCAGVLVTLSVTEGAAYAWGHAEWPGSQALAADALNKALGMKAGEPADAGKFDAGLRAVRATYRNSGYLAHTARYEPRLDDAARRAVFVITIDEGPQFHMGTLAFEGIRPSDAEMLSKKWTLKPGEVYDESYETKYLRDVILPLRTSGGGRGQLATELDPERRVVNVKVAFK